MELKAYLEIRGNAARLAKALGLSEGQVSQWKKGHRPVPAAHCPAIEHLTDRAVRCETIRPDVEWAKIRGAKKAA